LKTNVVESKQQEDEITITNYVYFSKISELAARAEVSNCRHFDAPDSKKSKTKPYDTKRCLSPTSSLDSSSDDKSTVVDEDELPIDELIRSTSKSSPRKSTRKNNYTHIKFITTKTYI
jgi:hypothetical protein